MKKRILNEELVIGAAVEVAKESGFEAVTLSRVAKKLDIQPQSMYRYADNSYDLRGKTMAKGLQELLTYLYQNLVGESGKAALKKLALIMVFGNQEQALPINLGLLSQYREHPAVTEAFQGLHGLIVQLLKGSIQDEEDLRQTAQLLIDLVLGENISVHSQTKTNQKTVQVDFEKNLDRVLALVMD
ncbi:TetR/AcrR family transcriptional regulator [Secundilactobacillus hailunensis]|uniref:TetR/AcrR family transcriptional regulator n=1 Tax=Secundilactobacillus hailunensis TaxID=2559923 RepID=A0ABW1TBD6_9LACO|nr:TetR/AcrR family transcriptional regulator [Secundilactobacillus hailunensis]